MPVFIHKINLILPYDFHIQKFRIMGCKNELCVARIRLRALEFGNHKFRKQWMQLPIQFIAAMQGW